MRSKGMRLGFLGLVLAGAAVLAWLPLGAQTDKPSEPEQTLAGEGGWPRKLTRDGLTFTVYLPQIEKWERNKLEARAALAIESKASPLPTFGVAWFSARTEVDKESRLVVLDDLQITKVNFPAAEEKNQEYLDLLRKDLGNISRTVALDRLEANLRINQAENQPSRVPLKNEPPRVIFSTKPAILVLIDGKPELRQVEGSNLLRVINTRALILVDQGSGKYFLHIMDHWLSAGAVEGPWALVSNPPAGLEQARKTLTDSGQPIDLLDDPAPDLKEEMEAGQWPVVYVSTVPAELLDTDGEPALAPLAGTQLIYVTNTHDHIILDVASQSYFALLSGRWFRSKSLKEGPWEFVAADKVPADFSKIPETHPKADVLANVSGTPQAKESLIANSIPQTSTIKRSEAKLTPIYDGDPKFQPIEATSLQYAANSPTAVIQINPTTYYAMENGVWFTAASPTGPWVAAATVPEVIYTIPVSSPVYYATNVYTYGATPEVIYCGYTPGYFGTCVAPYGCVVYGSGWYWKPWIGRAWYGRPWTYGYGASFRWSSGGWCFGFSAGVGRPWWGPVGWHGSYGGAWRSGWAGGWGGRYTSVHASSINYGNANVYNRWNHNVVSNRATNVNINTTRNTTINSSRTLNNVYAGADGGVYRRGATGWEQNTKAGWQSFNEKSVTGSRATYDTVNRGLNTDLTTRRAGEASYNNFHSTSNFGGYTGAHATSVSGSRSGSVSGFRAGGARGGRR